MRTLAVIPARLGATRLPRKPLRLLGGAPLIVRVWERIRDLDVADHVVVATDDEALVWLYTGRRAVPLYLYAYRGRETVVPDPAAHRAFFDRQGVTHVLLASASGESATSPRALVTAYPEWLVPVRRWDGGRWLFVVRSPAHDG